MTKLNTYRQALRGLADWDDYLLKESGLPGPRANLELVQAAADLGTPEQFRRWLALGPAATAAKTALEFLPLCGAVGLGRLLAEGHVDVVTELRRQANDPRWRVREGVAMALQRWGDADMGALAKAMKAWAGGTWLEQRAVAAGLCEPRLLADGKHAKAVLKLVNVITRAVAKAGPPTAKPMTSKPCARAWPIAGAWPWPPPPPKARPPWRSGWPAPTAMCAGS